MRVGEQWGPFRISVSREQLVRYAGAADDYNPIHYDDGVAQKFGLPGVIVHGMLNMGLMTRLVMEHLPPGSQLRKFHVRFRQVVQAEQLVDVSVKVKALQQSVATLEVQLGAPQGKPAVSGRMEVELFDNVENP